MMIRELEVLSKLKYDCDIKINYIIPNQSIIIEMKEEKKRLKIHQN